MRISDWSSDVCSSDLRQPGIGLAILLRGASAGRSRGLAVVLAGLGNAEAFLGLALGLGIGGKAGAERKCGGDDGGGGEGSGLHGVVSVGRVGVRELRAPNARDRKSVV